MSIELHAEFNKSKLDNGMRVVTEHHPYSNSAHAAIYIDKGTRDEPHNMNGVAHFMEHMIFKGTNSRSGLDIVKTLEAVGGDINAYTTREYICVHATTLKEDLSLSLNILLDLLSSAKFDEDDFEKEKQVVLQEIDMTKDQLEEYIYDEYFERAFKRQSLGRNILGTDDSVMQLDLKSVKEFYKKAFQPKNLILSVAGNVKHEDVVRDIEIFYASLEEIKEHKTEKTSASLSEVIIPERKAVNFMSFEDKISKDSEQTHLLYGFTTPSYHSENRFEAYLINLYLGGGMTSRLYQNIREEKGLAYSIYSSLNAFTDTSVFLIYAATSANKMEEVYSEIKKELKQFVDQGMSEEDLLFFKNQARGQIVIGSEDTESRMNSIAINEMIFQEYRSVNDILNEIESVSVKSMNEFIKTKINLNNCGTLFLGG